MGKQLNVCISDELHGNLTALSRSIRLPVTDIVRMYLGQRFGGGKAFEEVRDQWRKVFDVGGGDGWYVAEGE